MGSVAASQYSSAVESLTSGLAPAAQATAESSIAGALRVAGDLPGQAGAALRAGAETAFVDGLHFAVGVGAALAVVAAVLVVRNLPRHLAHEGAMHGAAGPVEEAAELGLAGVLPVFPDEAFPGDVAVEGDAGPPPGLSGGPGVAGPDGAAAG
jgi:hypothetical protein